MVTAVGMIIIASCLQVSCRIDELAARASALQALNDQVMLARNASGLAIWEVCGEDIDAHLTVRRLVRERSVFFPGSFDSDGAVRVVAALKVGRVVQRSGYGRCGTAETFICWRCVPGYSLPLGEFPLRPWC